MIDQVWYFQGAGLIGALLTQGSLIFLAKALSQSYWEYFYCALLLSLSSLLSLQSIIFVPYLREGCLLLVFLSLALATLFYFVKLRHSHRPKAKVTRKLERQHFVVLLYGLALVIDLLYAAYPAYRPDQWDYHLLVPKIISQAGSIKDVPMFFDHIFFTGSYEYFFTLPRRLIFDDTTMQAYTDSFSLLTLAILLYKLGGYWLKGQKDAAALSFLAMGFILFALPSHEMVINAKVEPFLLATSCIILTTLYRLKYENSSKLWFFLAYLSIAPLACKLIWLHFLASLLISLPFFLWLWPYKRPIPWQAAICGLSLGFLSLLPIFFKNYYFFKNPFHPMQTPLWTSVNWQGYMQAYWQEVGGHATTGKAYTRILQEIPAAVGKELRYVWLGLLTVFTIGNLRAWFSKNGWYLKAMMASLLAAILLWPFFYKAQIFPRFYYPLIALVLIPIFLCLSRSLPSWRRHLLLLLPLIMNSSLEVKLGSMLQHWEQSREQFYATMPPPLAERNQLHMLNSHRRQHFPRASLKEAAILADTRAGYFYDGLLLYVDSYDYRWLRQNTAAEACLWQFLQSLNINYLYAPRSGFPAWPLELATAIKQGEDLDVSGQIRYLSPELIRTEAAKCQNRQGGF